jgi:hypothetical protein
MATASELFEARHYPGVVALVSDALEYEPECVPLLLLRARSHIALRRDLDAPTDLRDIIRLDPQCSMAYRLLGELAARRDENESAAIFFREALRLDPGDREAQDWLAIVGRSSRPAAAASKLPAPAAAAGRFPPPRGAIQRARTAGDGQPRSVTAPARSQRPGSQPRFAHGTHTDDERPTKPFPSERSPCSRREFEIETDRSGSRHDDDTGRVLQALIAEAVSEAGAVEPDPPPPAQRFGVGSSPELPAYRVPSVLPSRIVPSLARGPRGARSVPPPFTQRPAPQRVTGSLQGAQPIRRPLSQPARGPRPELPGFGEYLVSTGILTCERLRAAQAYQRSMRVQLSTAIVTLGLASPQRIEWAAVAHQSHVGRGGA